MVNRPILGWAASLFILSSTKLSHYAQVHEFDTLRQKMLMENGFYSMEVKHFV